MGTTSQWTVGGEAAIDRPGERGGTLSDLPGLERKDIVDSPVDVKNVRKQTAPTVPGAVSISTGVILTPELRYGLKRAGGYIALPAQS